MTSHHYALTTSQTKTILDKIEHITKHAQDRSVILNDCSDIAMILAGAINNGLIES